MCKIDPERCPNKANHVSGWAANDRRLCTVCWQVYVRKEKRN